MNWRYLYNMVWEEERQKDFHESDPEGIKAAIRLPADRNPMTFLQFLKAILFGNLI